VKKKSLVESLELCTDTPIFLQANMADYGAQGGYGGDQGGFQQQDPNLVGGGQGGYDQQQAGGYDQEAIKQQKFVRSVAAACFSHRFDITHLLFLSVPPLDQILSLCSFISRIMQSPAQSNRLV
jgi:hypothetical protein